MSKILPARQFQLQHDNNELENVCPRYQKWLKKITNQKVPDKKIQNCREKAQSNSKSYMNFFSSRLSKRKRNKNKCDRHGSSESDDQHVLNGKSKEKPLRSKSIFFRIRQKGRNFGIRCKTSVELWRKWIKRGIHWDRSPLKPVDIDIISAAKPDNNKLKDFPKKSIINEIIPEEDEEDCESIVGRPSKQSEKVAHSANGGSVTLPSQAQTKDKSPERNFLSEISYIQRASNLFKHSKPNDEGETSKGNSASANGSVEEADRITGKVANGGGGGGGNQAKYPMNDLASMDIGRIEKIESASEKANGIASASAGAGRPRVPPPPHGALNRAFNKLKLFF